MNNVLYTVSGLINSESKTQMRNSLDKIKGVQKIGIDLAKGTVEIGYNEPADENQIVTCIENTGCKIE